MTFQKRIWFHMEEYAMQLDFSAGQWSKTHFHPFKKILCWKKSNFWIGQARIWILILLNISGMNWIDVFIVEVTQIRISSLLPYWKNGHNFHSSDCKILCIQCQIDVLLWSKLEGMQQNTDFFLRVQDIFVLLLHTWLTN